MADRKISDLTALTTPAAGDYLPIVDISEASASSKNKRITLTELFKIPDAVDIATGTTTGTKFGTSPSQKIGFFNATPVVQPTELTDELTTITHTSPGTPDYAVQDLVQNTGFGFVTKDEGNTVLSVILNLQIRLNEMETKLASLGLLADAD
jgi:hypothetical protein